MDATEVKKIAHLARIEINDNEIDHYANDLTNILHLIDQMNAVDTTNIEPLAHPLEIKQRLRNDEVTEVDQREHFQHCAPATEAGLYLVPKVIEEV